MVSINAVFLEQEVTGCRGSEVFDGDCATCIAKVAVPWQSDTGFDANASLDGRRQNLFAVVGVLLLEPVEAGHGHDASLHAFTREYFAGFECHGDLGTGSHDDDVRGALGVGEHVCATDEAVSGGKFGAFTACRVRAAG